MPLNWNLYDQYFKTSERQRQPIEQRTKEALEVEVASLLNLLPDRKQTVWGECSIPGCYGIVIRLPSDLRHRWNPNGARSLGLKVFHPDGFGKSARDLVPFHTKVRHRYPGLPSSQVQEVYDGGQFENSLPGEAGPRWYLIQEWIEGETWDEVLQRSPLGIDTGEALIRSLFEGIVFPLWERGVIWWDIRSNNYCVRECAKGVEVVMIDTDSLAAYRDEILLTPESHLKRDAKKGTGVKRLRTMIRNLSEAVLRGQGARARSSNATKSGEEERMNAFLATLAHPGPLRRESAQIELERMLKFLKENVWCF